MQFARAFYDPRLPMPTDGQIEEVLSQLTELEVDRLWELLEKRRRMRLQHIARFDQMQAELAQILKY
jgi:hypothetical protein